MFYYICIFLCTAVLFTFVFRKDGLVFSPAETTSQNYVLVEFHCLLSIHQWGFDDYSNVYICFAAKELGEFKYCYGPMSPVRKLVNCYIVLQYCSSDSN